MKLSLSQFKKVKEDKQSATLQHPEGHQIKISKKSLSTQMQNDLAKLPMHLAEGTPDEPVQNYSEEPSVEAPKSAPSTVINIGQPAPTTPQPMASMMPEMPAPAVPQAPPPMMPEAQAPQMPAPATQQAPVNQYAAQNDPYGANAYGAIAKEGLQNQLSGIQEGAKAEQGINQAKAKAYGLGISQQQQALNNFQISKSRINNEYGKFMQDYQNQHIDAQHYLNSMGTGGKISTAIGLILGGMGGGLMHQANPALDFLNKQIANDIDAQKANMDKGANLLRANMEHFKNEADATQMTGIMMRGILASRIESEGLKSSNPLVAARAKQAAGVLESQNANLMSQIAVRQTLQNQGQSKQPNQPGQKQTAQAIPPAQQIRMMNLSGLMPEADQKKAYEELGKKQEANDFMRLYQQSFDDIRSHLLNGTFSPADRDSAINILSGRLAKLAEGRFNLQEAQNQVDAIMPRKLGFFDHLESDETTDKKPGRAEQLVMGMTQTPTLDAYRVKVPDWKSQKADEGAPVGVK